MNVDAATNLTNLYMAAAGAYVVVAAAMVVLAVQIALIRLASRQRRSMKALEVRVGQMLAGLSLLTDTTEVGLRDVAHEIGRLASEAPRPAARAATMDRIKGAALRGRTIQDIAATEQLSESEVRLRLKLIEDTANEPIYAAVR